MSRARLVVVRLPLLQLARAVVREVQLCKELGLCPRCRRSLVALNQELTDVVASAGSGVASPRDGVAGQGPGASKRASGDLDGSQEATPPPKPVGRVVRAPRTSGRGVRGGR